VALAVVRRNGLTAESAENAEPIEGKAVLSQRREERQEKKAFFSLIL
jgi:hypothetical protein